MGGPSPFFTACAQLVLVGDNVFGIAPAVEAMAEALDELADQEFGAPEGADRPQGAQEVPRGIMRHRAETNEICDDLTPAMH